MPVLTSTAELHADNYQFLQRHVYVETGIVLEEDKHYLFECRLVPIVRRLGLKTIDDLCGLLQGSQSGDVSRQVVEAMTTNENLFFPRPRPIRCNSSLLLPRLIKERADTRKLRFWSAASSTGQEAYSLDMLLIQAGLGDWDIQILGTDFSSQVVERARSGRYLQIEVNRELPATLLVKHFRRADTKWQLSDAVRRMVTFDTIDLRKSMRVLGPFDLVFCRNVMIYFDAKTKKKILQELHGTLFRGGWLFLGGVETAFGLEQFFERESAGNAIAYVAR
jgi:chemotaxis protein methyltransferase CheR